MLVHLRVLSVIALVLPIMAQQAPQKGGGAVRPTTKPADTASAQPEGLTVDSVVALVGAGLSDDVIIARLRKEDKTFDLTTDEMIRLKKARGQRCRDAGHAQPEGGNQVAADRAERSRFGSASGDFERRCASCLGIRTAGASGAAPTQGAEAKGDPNDPLAPHDSGIYAMTKNRGGMPEMVVLERASYQGAKSGGMLTSAMTYGIVKAKTKAVIPGAHANMRINESSPVFYFYFDDKQAGLGKTYFGVGNLSNPSQFSLLKLEVNKQNRESTVGSFSALGSSSGADSKAMIPFKSERIKPGLYKVTVEGLKSGEYCFVASSNMGVQSPYGATASVATDIFDFGTSAE